MRGEYTITTELIYEPDTNWIAVKNVKTYTEDGDEVNKEIILTGEMAIGYKAHELLKRYAAFKEQQKQDALALEEKQKKAAIAVAKRLLGEEVPAQPLKEVPVRSLPLKNWGAQTACELTGQSSPD